jgi:hypothetical protein
LNQTPPAALFSLPNELHLEISSWLDYPSHIALSQTCLFFIVVEKPTTPELKLSFLFAAERLARSAQLLQDRTVLKLTSADITDTLLAAAA